MKKVLALMMSVLLCMTVGCGTVEKDNDSKASANAEEIELSEDFLEGIWVNENGFVCMYKDNEFLDYKGQAGYECTIDNNRVRGTSSYIEEYASSESWKITAYEDDSIEIYGVNAVRADSDTGRKYSDAIKKKLIGKWIIMSDEYNYNDGVISYFTFKEDTMGMSENIEDDGYYKDMSYTFENTEIAYQTDDMEITEYMYVKIKDETAYLITGEYVFKMYLEDSEKGKKIYNKYIDASDKLSGEWIRIIDDGTENWSFEKNGELFIDNEKHKYSAEYTNKGISLIVDDAEYIVEYGDYSSTLELKSDLESFSLYSKDSDTANSKIKKAEIENQSGELLKQYPDEDGWIEKCDVGDIPLLADAEYIKASLADGCFLVSTPQELASYCYYVNTAMTSSEGYLNAPMQITADIDLSGYEWSPMGWSGGSDHPFTQVIEGNNHTISGLTINSDNSNIGFIGWETFCGVKNLRITNAVINGGSCVGIMSGQAICGLYENCYVQGEVTGLSSTGSMLGHSTATLRNCSADVIVNGEEFNFLTYNDKAKSEIVIDNPVTITIDENYTITRPEVTGYVNLGWMVFYNGEEVLHRNAENEYSYTYFQSYPGTYEIYLSAFVDGQYVAISNTVTYVIE